MSKQKSDLKNKVEKLRLELKKQKEMYGNAQRGMIESQKLADARKEEVISKNNQIGKMENRIISLEGKVDGLRQELSKSQTSLEIVMKQKDNMQHELVALQKSNEDLQDALEEMKTKKDELQNEVIADCKEHCHFSMLYTYSVYLQHNLMYYFKLIKIRFLLFHKK